MKNALNALLCLHLLFLFGCQDDEQRLERKLISGYSQKGPFLNGTSITLSELNGHLSPTGTNFNTEIIDNKGTFELRNISLNSPYVAIRADGFYFNEVDGENSAASIILSGIADLAELSNINVNILTHLEKPRLEYLVSRGMTFDEAKAQAQQEVLAIFSISKEDVQSFETLDLSEEGDDNAILLAVSIITQGYRSEADLSELLANMSTDIREDGTLDSETVGGSLLSQTKTLNRAQIRHNVELRYDELGHAGLIPYFEKYLDIFIEKSPFDGTLVQVHPDAPVVHIEAYPSFIFDVTGNFLGEVRSSASAVTEAGFCWSTTPFPSIQGDHVAAVLPTGSGAIEFHSYIEALSPNTLYYFCAYAKNASGVGYSNAVSVQTKSTYDLGEFSTVTDVDGNEYKTVKIGDQWWMAENLRAMRFADGTPMVDGTQILNFKGDVTTKYYFNNPFHPPNSGELTHYGRYYTFAAAMNGHAPTNAVPSGVQGGCPFGWHIPSLAEFDILKNVLANYGYATGFEVVYVLREKGPYPASLGLPPIVFRDPFGFGLTFGGSRGYDFASFAVYEWNWSLWFSNQGHLGYGLAESGLNVRCVKD